MQPVDISPVQGSGSDAYQVVTVEGWHLTVPVGGEPLIRDIDLAERLGYERPRDVRKLIERLAKEKKLNDIEVRATVAQTSGGRQGREFWLTEEQALKVVAKSETAKADAMLDEIIRVFRLALRGLLSTQASITPTPSVTEERIARIETTLAELPQTLATSMATAMAVVMKETMTAVLEASSAQRLAPVGEAGSREIRRSLRAYGELMAVPGDIVSAGRWRQSGEVELRAHLGFMGAGRRWSDLSFDDYAKSRSKLAEMLQRARRNAEERGQMAQMPLKEATG